MRELLTKGVVDHHACSRLPDSCIFVLAHGDYELINALLFCQVYTWVNLHNTVLAVAKFFRMHLSNWTGLSWMFYLPVIHFIISTLTNQIIWSRARPYIPSLFAIFFDYWFYATHNRKVVPRKASKRVAIYGTALLLRAQDIEQSFDCGPQFVNTENGIGLYLCQGSAVRAAFSEWMFSSFVIFFR